MAAIYSNTTIPFLYKWAFNNFAAAAEVMTEYFGDKLTFTDTSLLEFGIANREIKSFRDAAQEAAYQGSMAAFIIVLTWMREMNLVKS